jgi:membrane dipeptidase
MKIFDIHSDLLYDLYQAVNKGIKNRFVDYHVPRFLNSPVKGGVWTLYSPVEFDLLAAVKSAIPEIKLNLLSDFQIILGLEGLRNLKLEDLDELYKLGIRHAMLTWNEENIYATGVRGKSSRGLTKLGKALLSRMEELDMIIDLSHLNEKSFYDVLEVSNKNIIFSHGNLRDLCNVPRNLFLEQMKSLKEVDGIIGLSLVKYFISEDPEKQNLDFFLNHLDRAVEVMGVDNLAFGFDFMDYFPNTDDNISEVPDITHLGLLIDGMKKRGYSETDIKKISYENFYQRFKDKILGGYNENY